MRSPFHKHIDTLWYENEHGERWYPGRHVPPWQRWLIKLLGGEVRDENDHFPPEGYIYQHSQFPEQITDNVLRAVVAGEVAECQHPAKYIKRTGGWLDGFEGRECQRCDGTQLRKTGERWPKKWSSGGSRTLMSGSCGYPGDLVLAMTRPSLTERVRQVYRYGLPAIPWGDYGQAVLTAKTACEACQHVLSYRHGLAHGYPKGSDEWKRAGTSCELCDPDFHKNVREEVEAETERAACN
jgi:hypothetical protein